jgi:Sulfatase
MKWLTAVVTVSLGLYAAETVLAWPPRRDNPADRGKSRPNILLILADDQRWDTIGALGNSEIRTPILDRLVARGFTFNNDYCMGSMIGAVCCRAAPCWSPAVRSGAFPSIHSVFRKRLRQGYPCFRLCSGTPAM